MTGAVPLLLSSISGATIGALIVAGAALIGSILTLLASVSTNKDARRQHQLDYALRQANELYGPLYMRRQLSLQLWKQLTGVPDAVPGKTKWRLIDHIEEIRAVPSDGRNRLVEQILLINKELSDLITGHAGLLNEFPPPSTFTTFLLHAELLQLLWDRSSNADPEGTGYIPFPGGLDYDISTAFKAVKKRLEDLAPAKKQQSYWD